MKLQFGELNITPRVEERLRELNFTVAELEDAIAEHKSTLDGEPSVYAGTYGKYNGGSLRGLWIDLSTFGGDYDEFRRFCAAIHADEEDPEMMFQDYEGFPSDYYDECMGRKEFEGVIAYIEACDEHGQEAVDAYISLYGDDNLDQLAERYMGEWDSKEDFAEHIFWEVYCDECSSAISAYIDYAAFARDLFMGDYDFEDGHVFRPY